ncbi:MAG: SRPBCC family protein [Acidimicrobiia bacterium]|nr:SRPBCC family protein [Acidimicrobiia bacterium]
MPTDVPDDVTTKRDRDTVSATAVVESTPEEIFEFLRRPANHAVISGDGSVRDTTGGDERLAAGSRFGMKMKIGVPYRVSSKVREFEENRTIAWSHFGGHRWRWVLEPTGAGATRVTETFDQSTAVFPPGLRLAGFPKRHEANVARSVANLRDHFAR